MQEIPLKHKQKFHFYRDTNLNATTHCHRLPRKVVMSLPLEMFKTQMIWLWTTYWSQSCLWSGLHNLQKCLHTSAALCDSVVTRLFGHRQLHNRVSNSCMQIWPWRWGDTTRTKYILFLWRKGTIPHVVLPQFIYSPYQCGEVIVFHRIPVIFCVFL